MEVPGKTHYIFHEEAGREKKSSQITFHLSLCHTKVPVSRGIIASHKANLLFLFGDNEIKRDVVAQMSKCHRPDPSSWF